MNKNIISFSVIIALTILSSQKVSAVTVSDFPSCLNPQGEVKASYSSGTHGIAGSNASYSGSDSVYQVDSSKLIQCFCDVNGSGIQTNWYKFSELSENEIEQYKKEGWIFIPDGSLWGLDQGAYLAKNTAFSCGGSSNGGSGSSDGRSDGKSDGRSDGKSTGITNGVSASIGSVLGLASTGNITTLYGFLSAGIAAFLLSFALRKKTK